jgi:Flp pilus assembly protein TadD
MAEQCYASAYQALEGGDDVHAKRLFSLLAILIPRDERPWIGLAVCSERQTNWAMAAALYGVGAALVKDSAWAHFGRGRALSRLGRRAAARRAFDAAEAEARDGALIAAIDAERTST